MILDALDPFQHSISSFLLGVGLSDEAQVAVEEVEAKATRAIASREPVQIVAVTSRSPSGVPMMPVRELAIGLSRFANPSG